MRKIAFIPISYLAGSLRGRRTVIDLSSGINVWIYIYMYIFIYSYIINIQYIYIYILLQLYIYYTTLCVYIYINLIYTHIFISIEMWCGCLVGRFKDVLPTKLTFMGWVEAPEASPAGLRGFDWSWRPQEQLNCHYGTALRSDMVRFSA